MTRAGRASGRWVSIIVEARGIVDCGRSAVATRLMCVVGCRGGSLVSLLCDFLDKRFLSPAGGYMAEPGMRPNGLACRWLKLQHMRHLAWAWTAIEICLTWRAVGDDS